MIFGGHDISVHLALSIGTQKVVLKKIKIGCKISPKCEIVFGATTLTKSFFWSFFQK